MAQVSSSFARMKMDAPYNRNEDYVEAEEDEISFPRNPIDHNRCKLDNRIIEEPNGRSQHPILYSCGNQYQLLQVLNPFVSARILIGVISAG